MFVEKFLIWKVFSICCLRWIVQFAVLECPPGTHSEGQKTKGFLDIVQRLVVIWSKSEFVQSTPMEQQACILSVIDVFVFPFFWAEEGNHCNVCNLYIIP